MTLFFPLFSRRPLEIDSDSSIEEFEDALNADEDIFSEPVPQNRLKYLSKSHPTSKRIELSFILPLQLKIKLKRKYWDAYSLSTTIVIVTVTDRISLKEL